MLFEHVYTTRNLEERTLETMLLDPFRPKQGQSLLRAFIRIVENTEIKESGGVFRNEAIVSAPELMSGNRGVDGGNTSTQRLYFHFTIALILYELAHRNS